MKNVLRRLTLAWLVLASVPAAFAVDIHQVEKELTTTGAVGWIHGASPSQGLYVFTYRNPQNFFDYLEMSLVSFDPQIQRQLSALNRHDQIRVHGKFLINPSPQKHIEIGSIELVKKFESTYASRPYEHEAKVPDELLAKTSAVFLVHAIGAEGHILVVEYKDTVLPIFVERAEFTKNLFRNDVVQLSFVIQNYPGRPVHLNLNAADPAPVKVLDSVVARHGQPADVEGALILFPKSPEILFNVFAVEQIMPQGLKRQYTLVNFDNPSTFAQIRAALQKAFDKYPGAYVNGRNKLVSTRIRVRAKGVFNEVDPNQANSQILLNSLGSIQILEK